MIHKPSWKPKQRKRLAQLLAAQRKNPRSTLVCYWCSDQWGRPANGGTSDSVYAGLVQTIKGPLALCGPKALHATREPHRWRGSRVWVVALLGERVDDTDKSGALKREFLGEVLPEDCIDQSVAARMGLYANLNGANLRSASLRGANLYGASLYGANMDCANLRGANMDCANLYGANLRGADLYGANLYCANLRGADLYCANLGGANLRGANLGGAYVGAHTSWLPDIWDVRDGYVCRKEE